MYTNAVAIITDTIYQVTFQILLRTSMGSTCQSPGGHFINEMGINFYFPDLTFKMLQLGEIVLLSMPGRFARGA